MNLRTQLVALCTVLLSAACSPDVVAPLKVPGAPNLAVMSKTTGDYIVLANGKGFPADFDSRVAALGGKVIYANNEVGFASVTGLTQAAATQLGRVSGLSMQADAVVALDAPAKAAPVQVAALSDPSIQSQNNPAGAFLRARQWNMETIHVDSLWKLVKSDSSLLGDSTVTVAIIDSGIDYDNRDFFRAATTTNPRTAFLVDTARSVSFVPSDDTLAAAIFPTRHPVSDFNGHGTNVASQVSSLAFAFAGVTSRTKLMGIKVLNAHGSGSLGAVLSGVLWAADNGADIANMSLGASFPKSGTGQAVALINRVFNYAKQKGMLIVVAAGNAPPPDFIPTDIQHNGNEYVSYCDAPHVVCVSAVGPLTYDASATPKFFGDTPAFYSFYGKSVVSVAAPGGNAGSVVSNWPWGADNVSWVWSFCSRQVISFSDEGVPVDLPCISGGFALKAVGTSQAAPHVSGLAALMVAKYGRRQPMMIRKLLENTGDPIDAAYGRSRINVLHALGL